jgi:peptidyl-prolyl cis-trans isomerase C
MLRALAVVVFAGAIVLAGAGSRAAESGGETATSARRAQIVARVGSRTVTVGELEDRIAAMPPFQRSTFGSTPDAVRHRFLMEVALPEALLSLAAAETRVEQQPPTSYRLERARSTATVRAIRRQIEEGASIGMDEVRSYYQGNLARYETPERIQVWRILCKTREEAQAVLAACKNDPTPKAFSDLAREHSQDKGTYLRGGNLGFVASDGTSAEPGLRVDPVVMRAVSTLRDGDLAPQPVAEGEYFSVVWRRGTLPAVHRRLDEVASQIRSTLRKNRVKDETDKLIAALRTAKLRDFSDTPLETVDLPAMERSQRQSDAAKPAGG